MTGTQRYLFALERFRASGLGVVTEEDVYRVAAGREPYRMVCLEAHPSFAETPPLLARFGALAIATGAFLSVAPYVDTCHVRLLVSGPIPDDAAADAAARRALTFPAGSAQPSAEPVVPR